MKFESLFVLCAAGILVGSACTGTIATGPVDTNGDGIPDSQPGQGGGNGTNGGNGNMNSGSGGTATAGSGGTVPVTAEPGLLPLRRLTRFEYNNTIRDLLNDSSNPAGRFPADDVTALGFASAINTSELMVTTAMESAESLATTAASKLETLVPCAANANDACAGQFIATFGRRAFRRPLTSDEKNDLMALYTTARTSLGYDFRGAIRVLLTGILQAPQFLYHWELGGAAPAAGAGGNIQLTAFELASRLSYFWGSMPDATLLDAAEAGRLSARTDIANQARRLLTDTRSRAMVSDFFGQLLFLKDVVSAEKDAQKYPAWTAEARTAAWTQTQAFVQDTVIDGDGLWRTLLTAPPKTTPLDGLRAGLLTQAAFLATQAGPADGALITPIRRGKIVRKRLLCQDIPPPLANVTSHPSSGVTTRQRLESHATDPQCAVCHNMMDDLGFAFENYDVTGRWRDTDSGQTVDASGVIQGLDSAPGKPPAFRNAVELAGTLAALPESNDCIVANLVRYGAAREETTGEVAVLRAALGGSDLNLRDAMIAIVTSDGFTRRKASAGEMLQ